MVIFVEYREVAWLSGQVVSDRQIYMDSDLPRDVL